MNHIRKILFFWVCFLGGYDIAMILDGKEVMFYSIAFLIQALVIYVHLMNMSEKTSKVKSQPSNRFKYHQVIEGQCKEIPNA